MQGWGYNKNEKLGKNDNGLLEPIILEKRIKNLGLGCNPPKISIRGKGSPIKKFKASLQLSVSTSLPLT